jgi:hypothetical protein
MIKKVEIKPKNTEETRIIFYKDDEESLGLLFNKQSLYDLFCKLREFYNEKDKI